MLSSWSDPASPEGPVAKVLVVGASPLEQTRRTFERELRDRINSSSRTVAVASLEQMEVGEELTADALRAHFSGQGIDALLATHVIDAQTTAEYEEADKYAGVSPYANDYFAYYRRLIVKPPDPGGFTEGRRVQVETILFDAGTGGVRWRMVTQSFDHGNTLKVIEDVIKLIVKELKRDGLLR